MTTRLPRFTMLAARLVAGALLGASGAPRAALADQSITASDNARIDCEASQRDLTRISLVGDAFSSVSKMQAEMPIDDFSVVNEPTRGDIYVSVPNGFRPKVLSFFGTSKKGYVYKFVCRVAPSEAQQIFITNPAANASAEPKGAGGGESADAGDAPDVAPPTPVDTRVGAVQLIQGMARMQVVSGYRLERPTLVPVKAGALSVQLIAQYRGRGLTGRVIRVENTGDKPIELTEPEMGPADAVAIAINNPRLAPRQVTTAFVVLRNGEPQ